MTRTLADTRNALETSLDASTRYREIRTTIDINPPLMIERIIELHLQLSVIFRYGYLLD